MKSLLFSMLGKTRRFFFKLNQKPFIKKRSYNQFPPFQRKEIYSAKENSNVAQMRLATQCKLIRLLLDIATVSLRDLWSILPRTVTSEPTPHETAQQQFNVMVFLFFHICVYYNDMVIRKEGLVSCWGCIGGKLAVCIINALVDNQHMGHWLIGRSTSTESWISEGKGRVIWLLWVCIFCDCIWCFPGWNPEGKEVRGVYNSNLCFLHLPFDFFASLYKVPRKLRIV